MAQFFSNENIPIYGSGKKSVLPMSHKGKINIAPVWVYEICAKFKVWVMFLVKTSSTHTTKCYWKRKTPRKEVKGAKPFVGGKEVPCQCH